ncbi:39S ribosomal protein L10, mitochondrial [Harpegnathos saltator]|uniref:Large ribosomal subunit protein uL10m n=2 Tax=Harpegnathos saltator TaxID=610380 RepID=E2BFP7_HARSA|nr:39S ribosomal protein L10, mitochondrial [Harpegnathos saltator]
MDDMFEFKVLLKKANMYLKRYSSKIMKLALEDSPYAASLPLYSSSFTLVFSPDMNVAAFEKISKKCPSVVLLAGILEGRLLNKENFLRYGKSDLTTSRMHLVQVLQNAGGNNLNQQLTQHQSTLVARLKQISINEAAPDKNEKSVPV